MSTADAPTPPPPSTNTTSTTTTNIKVLHFNDVYNANRAPRFVHTLLSTYNEQEPNSSSATTTPPLPSPLVIFSGDAFNPSILSTTLRGLQMIPILNSCHITAACLGNHDLDFGLQEFDDLRKGCNFPWLCSNVKEQSSGRFLGGCEEYLVLDYPSAGGGGVLRILLLGLIEPGWIETLSAVDPMDIVYEDYNTYVSRRVPELVQTVNDGMDFDLILAVTHMRMANDYALAKGMGGRRYVDAILGGHDHHYEDTIISCDDDDDDESEENGKVGGVRVLNSGTDFHDFTVVEFNVPPPRETRRKDDDMDHSTPRKKVPSHTQRVRIPKDGIEDPTTLSSLQEANDLVLKQMDVVIGRTKVSLDARFAKIRTQETNVSNFVADLMCLTTNADVAILNSGTLRADRIMDGGELKVGDVLDLLPMADETVVIELTGTQLWQALENGVSKYPSMEGRFPCVSGVRFEFDPTVEDGESRILPESILVRRRSVKKEEEEGEDGGSTSTGGGSLSYNPSYGLVRLPPPSKEGSTSTSDEKTNGPSPPRKNRSFLNQSISHTELEYQPLILTETYSVVTKSYLAQGKDGYDVFKDAPVLRDDEHCPVLPTLVRNFFIGLKTLEQWHSTTSNSKAKTVRHAASKFLKLDSFADHEEVDPYAIAPECDGRICNVALSSS